MKIGALKFWPSYHYSSVVQTASNWNLQKLLKSELEFMRYCNLKIRSNMVECCHASDCQLAGNANTLALPTNWQRRANILAGDGLSCFRKKMFWIRKTTCDHQDVPTLCI